MCLKESKNLQSEVSTAEGRPKLSFPGLEALAAGGGESFPSGCAPPVGDMGAVSTGFLCHSGFRLSLAAEDAAEHL